ncbi:MAG TPA: DUF3140 domain-containing protein [Pseudonocardia sp.]|jgi:hypothetical protein|uniref:DUF3140 domain-containing protein n=1 Tax=Pseudonocardia sp. TaxID=60912 RepID=UPI002ED7E6F1
MATATNVDDDLWNDFHRLVNMSSRELRDWLRTRSAEPDHEELPDQSGSDTGQHVLRLLGKRRSDVTAEDAALMRRVVRRIERERGTDPEPTAGDAPWRRRLMTLGHDPLKPI